MARGGTWYTGLKGYQQGRNLVPWNPNFYEFYKRTLCIVIALKTCDYRNQK
jgi:hypothetical protein